MKNILSNWSRSLPISISRRNNPFSSIQRALDKSMEDFQNFFHISPSRSELFENLTIMPSIDIINSKESFKVEAEMPGLDEENIKVSIKDGILEIKGEKTVSKKDKDNKDMNYLSREIDYGSYERFITLPESVDIDKAKATFKKGMLWVEIPKKPETVKESRELTVEKGK